jgi:hypothetical protein
MDEVGDGLNTFKHAFCQTGIEKKVIQNKLIF